MHLRTLARPVLLATQLGPETWVDPARVELVAFDGASQLRIVMRSGTILTAQPEQLDGPLLVAALRDASPTASCARPASRRPRAGERHEQP